MAGFAQSAPKNTALRATDRVRGRRRAETSVHEVVKFNFTRSNRSGRTYVGASWYRALRERQAQYKRAAKEAADRVYVALKRSRIL